MWRSLTRAGHQKRFIGPSERQFAGFDFANAKFWIESKSCVVRRLVSQGESLPSNIKLYSALLVLAHEHLTSETTQMPIVLMTFGGKHFSLARVIARVSCIARWGMAQVVNGHMRCRLAVCKRLVDYSLFLQYNWVCRRSKLIKNCSKFCKKIVKMRPGRVSERGPRDQMPLGHA